MVSLRRFFKKTSVQKHYTEIVKNGIAFMLSLTRTHSLCETENLLPIISDTFFTSEKIFAFTQLYCEGQVLTINFHAFAPLAAGWVSTPLTTFT